MMQKNIKKNYILNLFYQTLQLITPLITAPYLSRVLGADGIGSVSYAESIVTYFGLFASLGIAIHGQREISYAQDDLKKRSLVFWNTKLLSLCTTGIALMAYVVFALTRENRPLYLILSLSLLSVGLDVTWFFQGMEEFGKIVLRNTIIKLINVVYIFLMIRTSEDILFYATGYIGFPILANLSLWCCLPKYITRVAWKDLTPFRDLKVILSLFLPTIAVQVYTVLDKTMIGMITHSDFENGYYEQALKISKMVLTVVSSITVVMIPRVGYYFEKRDHAGVIRLINRSFRFLWFLGLPLWVGLVMVSEHFVPWFFGPGYEKVADLLKILSFLVLFIGISGIIGTQYWVPTKRQNLVTKTVILGACVNFFLNLFLIPRYHSSGAAIASIAAEFSVTAAQLYLVRKELPLRQLFRESRTYVVAVGTMAASLAVLGRFLVPTILGTVLMVITGATVYFAVLMLQKDEFFISNIHSILQKFNRKTNGG